MIKIYNIKSIGLVCAGNELFSHIVNSNIHTANRIFESNGFELNCNIIVPDDPERIKSAVRFCLENDDAVVVSGGLGPTFDDMTREAVADLIGKKLIFSEDAWNEIQQRFVERKVTNIPEKNKKQAMIIEGAKKIPNRLGTAPGMMIDFEGKSIFLLPGPPVEFEEMLLERVVPELLKRINSEKRERFVSRGFGIVGEPEALVEEKTVNLREKISCLGGRWTILALPYLIELWLKLPETKRDIFDEAEITLKEIFKESFLGTDGISIPESLLALLKEKGIVCCFAESCTGGLAGHLITEIPGSSECFNGTIVAYSNKLKKKILKVPKTVLRKYGAVSKETAIAMAKGARKYGKADVSLAITGIAGPSGATPDKPVGLVWMAVCTSSNRFEARNFYFSGKRSTIKLRAALAGIDFMRRTIKEVCL
ncbi:MAG: CinA family nicotinamide mononucleotide deamidase-related protein [Candidatus Omnitrophica bacterium]|nr:CinA family nicotinamide mononucleotide deamidase-related protein [Candidatus Omnitrophota bacterium]MCM8827982.1 CinA family nicotinamide mononucleotide deamidase-related protein [Candidatus Omnitrophota bacterium]